MKKVFFLVAVVVTMVSCSKENGQIQPTEVKNQRVVYDTLYIIDEEFGEAVMVVEERIIK